MGVEALGNQIARPDVQKEPGEDGEHEAERGGGRREPLCRSDSSRRGGSVDAEPAECPAALATILDHDVHRVDAVREIVRQHRDCDDHADAVRGLKRESDRNAVQEAVQRQDAGAERAAPPGSAVCRRGTVDQHQPVDRQIEQESHRRQRQRRRLRAGPRRQCECLRQQVEEYDAEHRAGTEAEHEVQSVLEFPGEGSAGQRAQKGRAGDGGE
jgi:hypothetical protein